MELEAFQITETVNEKSRHRSGYWLAFRITIRYTLKQNASKIKSADSDIFESAEISKNPIDTMQSRIHASTSSSPGSALEAQGVNGNRSLLFRPVY
jgi:hypothetical protein